MSERVEWAACRQRAEDEAERTRHYPTVIELTERGARVVSTSWKEWHRG